MKKEIIAREQLAEQVHFEPKEENNQEAGFPQEVNFEMFLGCGG